MTTPAISIYMFIAAALFGALGQYLYKSGADAANGTLAGYIMNPRLLSGVICYIAVMVLFVAAFRKGGALTVLYPIYATTFGTSEPGTLGAAVNIGGMALLVAGMYLMGK